MNLPEYRRALRAALDQYAEVIEQARRHLDGALEKINGQFLEDEDRPMRAEETIDYDRKR